MSPVLEETIYLDFITSNASRAAADADFTPTAEVFENATDTTVTALTVVKRTGKTGNYRIAVACTAANGFEAGKSYNVVASATVGGVAAKAVVARFQVVTKSGYKLAGDGLDAVTIETGVNARQALCGVLAATTGVLSGAATDTIVVKGGNSVVTRITAACDLDGNRLSVTMNLPT